MKRLVVLATIVTILASCEKDYAQKSYTFVNSFDGLNSLISINEREGFDTEYYTYYIYEYAESGQKIKTHIVDRPIIGKEYKFIAIDEAHYLTIAWQFSKRGEVLLRYLARAIPLDKKKNIRIDVRLDSNFQKEEPHL
jgi:hypothetical protein